MGLIEQGGMMIWPLMALSVPALGVILERLVFFISHPFPTAAGGPGTAGEQGIFNLFFQSLEKQLPTAQKEEQVAMAAKQVLFVLGRRLDFLSTVATTAPLLGLLGTVVGMVQSFSRLAGAGSGSMDISLLADGIWHALLTTAAGLVIAIPTLMAYQWFRSRIRHTAFLMESHANRVIHGEPHD